jgi:hypothetical protein
MDQDIRAREQDQENLEEYIPAQEEGANSQKDIPDVKFPTKLFIGAVAKDLADLASAGILVPFFGIFHKIALFANVAKKEERLKNHLTDWLEKRIMLQAIEFVPVLGIVPISTILVISMYQAEKEEVEAMRRGE